MTGQGPILPAGVKEMVADLRRERALGQPIDLPKVFRFKSRLKSLAELHDTETLYKQALAPGPNVTFTQQKILFLDAVAANEAETIHVLHEGGEPVRMQLAKVFGNASGTDINGTARSVFVAAFRDATAITRTSTIQLSDGRFVFDLQAGEMDGLQVDLAFDSAVLRHTGTDLVCINDSRENNKLRLPEAIALFGGHSVNFGHWMMEEFWKFLGTQRIDALRSVPILIDAGMPPQHRESIELFVGARHPIVEVPAGSRVQADKLWVCNTHMYNPKMLLTDKDMDPSALAFSSMSAASLMQEAWSALDNRTEPKPGPERIYLTRPPDSHRAVDNHREVRAFLEEKGYGEIRPETLSFEEQFTLYRSCTEVVLQSGSAMLGLFMCRPGTKVVFLSHPSLPVTALWTQMMADLGMEVRIVVGEATEQHQQYSDRANYTLDIGLLAAALHELREFDDIQDET